MKKKKAIIGEILGEILAEVGVTAVLFGIGAFVVHLLGVDFAEMDIELVAMIGYVVLIVLLLIVCLVVDAIKKRIKRKRNQADSDTLQQE